MFFPKCSSPDPVTDGLESSTNIVDVHPYPLVLCTTWGKELSLCTLCLAACLLHHVRWRNSFSAGATGALNVLITHHWHHNIICIA